MSMERIKRFFKNEEDDTEEMELNYNDRMDGYGFGPPESFDRKQPYQQERPYRTDMNHDEHGMPNQYGPVDQYNFRDKYERRWSSPRTYIDDDDDWREWGKNVGKGPKDYQRSDTRIYDEVCEVLMRDPDLDATHIEVKVQEGIVYLYGIVDSRESKKMAEMAIEHIGGFVDIQNLLKFNSSSHHSDSGPFHLKH